MRKASPPPQCISLELHRDDSHLVERGARWVFLGALAALAVAALANVFGQHHVILDARSGAATLHVSAPGALRSGLISERLTLEDLAQAARLQQVASPDDVEWAIIESTGQISVIPHG